MAKRKQQPPPHPDWPPPPAGRDVVLHTRVVTETGGGPDKTILLSASFLDHTNYWLAAAYMHPPDEDGFNQLRQRARAMNSPLISVPDRGPLDQGVLRRLLKLCRYYNVRIWHGHDYKSNLLGLTLRPFWPMKLITTVHGWVKHTVRTPLYYAVDRWCLPYYHHVICVSEDLVERVTKLGVPPQRWSLIHNAIDETAYRRQYRPEKSPLRIRGVVPDMGSGKQHTQEGASAQPVPKGRLVIGAVGRLSPEKAFNNLIRAVHALIEEGFDIELWIAGQGDSRDELQVLVDHLGLRHRVKLLGFCANTIELYHALDVFVLSSLREGLPNVLLEAMAMSIPVVSTRVAGVPNLITDGQTGLLCQPGYIDELVGAIRRVLADDKLRERLATNGRARIEESYSFTQRMAKVKAIYDQVLGVEPASQADPSAPIPPTPKRQPA